MDVGTPIPRTVAILLLTLPALGFLALALGGYFFGFVGLLIGAGHRCSGPDFLDKAAT